MRSKTGATDGGSELGVYVIPLSKQNSSSALIQDCHMADDQESKTFRGLSRIGEDGTNLTKSFGQGPALPQPAGGAGDLWLQVRFTKDL